MKFGGSSVESGDAILRLAGTVKSHLARQPVVVVSAMARRQTSCWSLPNTPAGRPLPGSRCLDEVQDHHFEVAGQVANGDALQRIETLLQRSFRDLRVILFEVADEGREVTPAL